MNILDVFRSGGRPRVVFMLLYCGSSTSTVVGIVVVEVSVRSLGHIEFGIAIKWLFLTFHLSSSSSPTSTPPTRLLLSHTIAAESNRWEHIKSTLGQSNWGDDVAL